MIRLEKISKYYHSNNGVSLGLRKINLEFRKGEFVAITGESGSGKSTLLNVLSGNDTYEEGELYVNGMGTSHFTKEEWEDYRRDYIGFVYQGYNLIDSYTVLENVKAAIIIREDYYDMDEKAMRYLEKVGLTEVAYHKATELSSGQKQRLSIARALAKETETIVADEPTGNLDVENGMEIMGILHELSKEKLVIVVTHNYDQAAPFATRKIRLFDGEVAEDMDITHNPDGTITEKVHMYDETDIDETIEKEPYIINEPVGYSKRELKMRKYKVAWDFVKNNRYAQPRRNILIFLFCIFLTTALFIFLGSTVKSLKSSTEGVYSDVGFKNGDKTRIVVYRNDGEAATATDVAKISALLNVEEVELWDTVADINYFCVEGKDYETVYRSCESVGHDEPESTYITLTDFSKFMRSSTCITEDDLYAGSLPVKANEIVIYSNDESVIGTTITYYFSNQKLWNSSQYMAYEMTVVGILKTATDQTYFSEELCRTISVDFTTIGSELYYVYGSYGRGVTTDNSGLSTTNYSETATAYIKNVIFKPNSDLSDDQILVASVMFDNACEYKSYAVRQCKICRNTLFVTGADTDAPQYSVLKIQSEETLSSYNVVEISAELFDSLFETGTTTQLSVYIDDYAHTASVIKALETLGYTAVSAYDTGVTSVDLDQVYQNIKIAAISLVALIFVFLLGWMLEYILLMLKKGDFIIFKSIGMSQKLCERIIKTDVYSNMIASMLITIIAMVVLSWWRLEFIYEILVYYNLFYFILYIAIVLLLSRTVSHSYCKFIKKKESIIDLRSE